jgi:hypothetical protein
VHAIERRHLFQGYPRHQLVDVDEATVLFGHAREGDCGGC